MTAAFADQFVLEWNGGNKTLNGEFAAIREIYSNLVSE